MEKANLHEWKKYNAFEKQFSNKHIIHYLYGSKLYSVDLCFPISYCTSEFHLHFFYVSNSSAFLG